MDQNTIKILGIGGVGALIIVAFTFLFLRETPALFATLLLVAAVVLFAPLGIIKYAEVTKVKQHEEAFPQFISDMVKSVRSGMTLPQAIRNLAENEYGALTPQVRKLNAQLEWGIPFSTSFLNFTKETKSRLIQRIGSTIIESHQFGGNIIEVFESISETALEIENLREERKLFLNSQMISGYIIFFVFLVVLIGLQKFLVPALSGMQPIGEESVDVQQTASQLNEEYKSIFRNLIILQGLFAGLVTGKMAEGAMAAGLKHSGIMVLLGVFIFTVATF